MLHAITSVRKPGVGDNDPAPGGSGVHTTTNPGGEIRGQIHDDERDKDKKDR